jgi:hypothetical protein
VVVDIVVAKLVNIVERVWPRVVTATIMTKAIKAKRMVYSTALAPASSLKKPLNMSKVDFPYFRGVVSPLPLALYESIGQLTGSADGVRHGGEHG